MGRGKKQAVSRGRSAQLPLSDGGRSSHDSAPVTAIRLPPVPHYQLEELNGLFREIGERTERELEGLRPKESLFDYMGLNHPEGPLRWFIDYVVFDECQPPAGLDMAITVDDANMDDLDGIAVIFPDGKRSQEEPVPGMQIYVDWDNYQGPEGVAQLADEFYFAFDRLKEALASMPGASAAPAAPDDPH